MKEFEIELLKILKDIRDELWKMRNGYENSLSETVDLD